MKTTLFLATLLFMGSVWAGAGSRVILADSKTFQTMVSFETVRCSQVGYGARELKINLAGLDGWTLFDHTNSLSGEFGEPCMTAGQCKAPWNKNGFTVESLVQNRPGLETITVSREVIEMKYEGRTADGAGGENDVCVRSLIENLKTNVRGIEFLHSRTGAEQNFPIEVCRK